MFVIIICGAVEVELLEPEAVCVEGPEAAELAVELVEVEVELGVDGPMEK